MRLARVLLLISLAAGLARAGEVAFPEGDEMQPLTPKQLLAHLIEREDANAGPALIDTRGDGLYARDHIPGAIHVHAARILDGRESLDAYRERGVILYSGNGASARRVALELIGRGHRKVFFLEGTIREWRFAGYPLESAAGESAGARGE